MKKELGKEYPIGQPRREFIANNCTSAEKKTYMKRFSKDELVETKEELSEVAIQINDLEEEKKALNDRIKLLKKPIVERKKEILKILKLKGELVNETCFKFVDPESREVGFYNEDGELIESRPAFADELQTNIFNIGKKTGTDD